MTQRARPESPTRDDLLRLPATVDIETGGRAFGLGRTTAYALAKAGTFPCKIIRAGNAYRVITADLLRVLDIVPACDEAGSSHPASSDEHAPIPTSAN